MRNHRLSPALFTAALCLCACLAESRTAAVPGRTAQDTAASAFTQSGQAQASPACPGAESGSTSGLAIWQVPDMTEPAARVPFRDPVFGTCLVRVTDRGADLSADDASAGLTNEYSRVQSFNADGTRILAGGTEGSWYLYDALTLLPLGELPLEVEPRWSATDPDLIYFVSGTRLLSFNIAASEPALVHEFSDDLAGYGAVMVWTRFEGSPSADGRWWGFMAEDSDWLAAAYLVYDLQTDSVAAIRDLRGWDDGAREIDSVSISPRGDYFLAFMDRACGEGRLGTNADPCGLMAYGRDLRGGRGLLRIVGHADTALDPEGRDVLVYQDIDADGMAMLDLDTGSIAPLWPIDFTRCAACGVHFSGRAFRRPGWAVVSYFDGDPVSNTWMDDSVFAVELRSGGRVVRLAHHHSATDPDQDHDYRAEPHAGANPDLTRILFTTNWGRSGTDDVEMYMILLPQAF